MASLGFEFLRGPPQIGADHFPISTKGRRIALCIGAQLLARHPAVDRPAPDALSADAFLNVVHGAFPAVAPFAEEAGDPFAHLALPIMHLEWSSAGCA